MNIAFVIPSLESGGAERVVSLLSLHMSIHHNVKVVIFNNKVDYNYGGQLVCLNLPSVKNPLLKVVTFIRRILYLKFIFKKNKFDKIFSFMESANFPTSLTGCQVILSVRTNPDRFSSLTLFLMRILYNKKNVKKIVSVSKGIQRRLIDNKIFNTITIYNPLNIQRNIDLSSSGVEISHPYIIAIGRLDKVKNFELLIRSYAMARSKKFLNLLILGEGNERKRLLELVKELKLESKISLYGRTANVYKFLSKAKMLVLTSRYEGFPNVLIESFSCGVPCISVNCETGPNEIIDNNNTGLLVQNYSIDEISNAIDKLYFDNELRACISINSKLFSQKFNIDDISKKWIEI